MEQETAKKKAKSSGGISAFMKTVSRSIKSTFNRYLSIILIVGIGGGFFAGVRATAPSMRLTAENYFNKYSMMDLEVLSTVGFSEEDARAVEKIPHIKDAMVGFSVDLIMENEETGMAAKVFGLHGSGEYTKGVNDSYLLEGRYPEDYNECVIAAKDYNGHEYKIGETVRFSKMTGETDVDTILGCREYTVVGIVRSPMYFSYEYGSSSVGSGTTSIYLMIPPVNFLYERFTELCLTLDCEDYDISPFSEEYNDILDEVTDELTELGKERYAAFVEEQKKALESAETEFDSEVGKAKTELEAALQKLNDAKGQLDGFKTQLDAGWDEYYSGKAQMEKELLEAYQKLVDGEKQINENEQILISSKHDYEVGLAQYDSEYYPARNRLDEGWAEYNAGLRKYNAGYDEYSSGLSSYRTAVSMMQLVKSTLSEAELLVDSDDPFSVYAFIATSVADLMRSRTDYDASLGGYDPASAEYLATALAVSILDTAIDTLNGVLNLHDRTVGAGLDGYFRSASEELITASYGRLRPYDAQLDDLESQLDAAKAELDAGKAELDAALAELNAGEAELEGPAEEARKKLADAKKQIADGEKELAEAKKALAEGKTAYEDAKASAEAQLADALRELQAAEEEFNSYQSEYDDGLWIYNQRSAEANAEIADAEARISGAKLQLEEIEEGKWYVFTRGDQVPNYSSLIDDSARIDSMMTVFPLFFLLVAALVCLTTMSRMVDEERGQIGTFKSLGYSNFRIVSKYVIYAGSAAIVGIVFGEIICLAILPKAVFGAYKLMYDIPNFTVSVSVTNCVIAFVVGIICTVVVAWYCCRRELRSAAATLMRPKAPPAGKEILLERIKWLWNRMGFFKKVTARNLFRYKARLIMTVIGISGCMTLLVSGFGIQDSINPLVDLQFNQISKFDFSFIMQKGFNDEEVRSLAPELLSDERVDALSFASGAYGEVWNMDKTMRFRSVQLTVFQDNEQMKKIYDLKNPYTKEHIEIGDGDIIITEKLAEKLKVSEGDKVLFEINDVDYEFTVTGIAEYYVYHYVFMNPATYEQVFGEDTKFNCIFMKGREELTSAELEKYASDVLAEYPSIISATNVDKAASIFEDCIAGLRKVVYIMITSAGMLAFVVLYNLTNINISERIREIATIKVLGFKNNETNSYVFRENIIMALMGIVFGCFGGYFLANYIVLSTEVESIMFYRHVEPLSYVYAAALTVIFTLCVNAIMSVKIRKIQMVESLKAVE